MTSGGLCIKRTLHRVGTYLSVKNCPVHHAAAEDDPLGGHHKDQASAQPRKGVSNRLPNRVIVGDARKIFPFAALSFDNKEKDLRIAENFDILLSVHMISRISFNHFAAVNLPVRTP